MVIEYFVFMFDVVEMLVGLWARGFYVGVVSNVDDDFLGAVLEWHGIDSFVDYWMSLEEVELCKFDSRIYEYFLVKVGCLVVEMLFVGDSF